MSKDTTGEKVIKGRFRLRTGLPRALGSVFYQNQKNPAHGGELLAELRRVLHGSRKPREQCHARAWRKHRRVDAEQLLVVVCPQSGGDGRAPSRLSPTPPETLLHRPERWWVRAFG